MEAGLHLEMSIQIWSLNIAMTPAIFPVSLSLHRDTVRRQRLKLLLSRLSLSLAQRKKFTSGDTWHMGLLPAASVCVMLIGIAVKSNAENKRSKVQGVRGTSS